MKKTQIFLSLLLVLLFPSGLQATTDYDAYYEKCAAAMQNADYSTVLNLTNAVLSDLPADSLDVRLECYSYLTGAYCRLGKYNEALLYADSCLTYDEQSGDPKNIANSLHNMACICTYLDLYEDAEHYLRRAVDLERNADPDNTENLVLYLGLLGEVYHLQGRPQMALDTTLLAYRLDSIAGREENFPYRYSQLAAAFYEMELYDIATSYISKAIPPLREDSAYVPLVICYIIQGEIYSHQQRFGEALTYGKMALELASSHSIRQQMLDSYVLLSEVAPTWKERYDYMHRAYLLNDSILTDEVLDRMTHLSSVYHLSEKDIVISQQEAKLYKARIHIIYYHIAVVVLFLLLLIICIILQVKYLHYQRDKALKAAVALAQKTKDLPKNAELSDENGQNDTDVAPAGTPISDTSSIKEEQTEKTPMKPKKAATLTDRELEVVRLCCQGLSSKQIADKMCLSARTIEGYKRSAFGKLKVSSTVELVIYAMHHDLL